MKNPLTPAGIEPATFRFVAQHLNHCAAAVLAHVCTLFYMRKGPSPVTELSVLNIVLCMDYG